MLIVVCDDDVLLIEDMTMFDELTVLLNTYEAESYAHGKTDLNAEAVDAARDAIDVFITSHFLTSQATSQQDITA